MALTGPSEHPPIISRLQNEQWVLHFQNSIFVPDDEDIQQLLRSRHDAPAAGHEGRAKTVDLVARTFYWPTLCKYVHRYVDGCELCQCWKSIHDARYGLLQWIPAAADFIVKLPDSNGFDSILVVIEKNTKLVDFIVTNETINSSAIAILYLHHVWKHHGIPDEIISDHGRVFISKFMKWLNELFHIQPSPMTTFHPQSHDKSERVN